MSINLIPLTLSNPSRSFLGIFQFEIKLARWQALLSWARNSSLSISTWTQNVQPSCLYRFAIRTLEKDSFFSLCHGNIFFLASGRIKAACGQESQSRVSIVRKSCPPTFPVCATTPPQEEQLRYFRKVSIVRSIVDADEKYKVRRC